MSLVQGLIDSGIKNIQKTKAIPERVVSAHAYLGSLPTKLAVDGDAHIVISVRSIDSAVTLGLLTHEFKWDIDTYDLLARGSLVGHMIGRGVQGAAGLHTDWDRVSDWDNRGHPIIEYSPDGRLVTVKLPNTFELVKTTAVGEQILYEIGDPGAYILPDGVCDFTRVQVIHKEISAVEVRDAHGRASAPTFNFCATYIDGFFCHAQLAKAARAAEANLKCTQRLFAENAWENCTCPHADIIGVETIFGPHAKVSHSREAIMRLAVMQPTKAALELFGSEISAAGPSWALETTGLGGPRPSVSPSIRQSSFLLDKNCVILSVVNNGMPEMRIPRCQKLVLLPTEASIEILEIGELMGVPLIRIGNISNIGIIAENRVLSEITCASDIPVCSRMAHAYS